MQSIEIALHNIDFTGRALHRPECVLCTARGGVYVSDWRGGVTRIGSDGHQTAFLAVEGADTIKPNGIALRRDGSFLLANLGDEGGVWRLQRSGQLEPWVQSVDGVDLPPSNFVLIDDRERAWITVSTRRTPRALGYRPDVDDGFIVLVDDMGSRIVADGLGYTNEVQLDGSGNWLYVNETFGRRLSRFKVSADGSLCDRETVTAFGHGTYPDGMTFDQNGGIWITSIVSNRVIRVTPDGEQQVVLEDVDHDWLAEVEEAYQGEVMDRPHLDKVHSHRLRNISSLAFGGPDLRTVYLGCLLGERLATFRSPVAGRAPVHWRFDD